jgi:hypothetical protein
MPPVLVLLAGWSQSGKDSVAKILVESYEFERFAFADPIKEEVATNHTIPLEWCHDQKKKAELLGSTGRTLREEIIRVAEEARRDDPGCWAKKLAQQIQKEIKRGHTKFVISDWRNLEELLTLQRLLSIKILPVHVVRPTQIISPVPDRTEYSLLGFPFWKQITNESTLPKLLVEVIHFMEEFVIPYIECQ